MKSEDVVIRESHEPLAELDPAEFDLKPQYVKQGLTSDGRVFLRETVVEKLRAVKSQIAPGWNIRIWDGWRSMDVQKALYERLIAKLTVEHPGSSTSQLAELARGYVYPPISAPPPPHTTGGTVDLTLVDANGQAIDFGTAFDDFTERAHTDYFDHHASGNKEDVEAKANRAQLFYLMNEQDFVVNPKEWWHFTYGTAQWAAAKGIELARYGKTQPRQ